MIKSQVSSEQIINYRIPNDIFHFGFKLGVILILISLFIKDKSYILLFSLTYCLLSFFLFLYDEMYDVYSKTDVSIELLIICSIISLLWYFFKGWGR